MVTVTANYNNSRYRASPGEGYDGVVQVSVNGYYGTGSLLYDGRAILTAAHLFEGASSQPVTVTLETATGEQTLAAARVLVHPGYDTSSSSNDLAIVWLPQTAPASANRYNLYRTSDELGHTFDMVGYGLTGSGSTGRIEATAAPTRHIAWNQFDGLANELPGTSWHPLVGTQLIADFDSGSSRNDALGQLIGVRNTGLGVDEGLIAPGDSGGPAFINGLVAGVASYTTSYASADIDSSVDSSFGEIAAWQRASVYQQWIDQSLRAQYPNAPTRPSEVQTSVLEGNAGTHYAYFMVSVFGAKNDQESVEYSTRDGTATAGQDYIPVQGALIIYPGEQNVVIPVEIISDQTPEPNEVFYLDLTHPTGGTFPGGLITLTASRTIVNDDGVLLG